jgi:hypothetical protein
MNGPRSTGREYTGKHRRDNALPPAWGGRAGPMADGRPVPAAAPTPGPPPVMGTRPESGFRSEPGARADAG